jgi:hypothetical protein
MRGFSRGEDSGRIISVDADVLSSQVGGDKHSGSASPSKLHPDVAVRLRQSLMSLFFVEGVGDAVAANHLPGDEDAYFSRVDWHTGVSHCGQYASPVWIGASPSGLYQ